MLTELLQWIDEIAASPWFLLIILVVALVDAVFPVAPSET